MNRIFITATGTEIGKTLVTAALCQQLRAQGASVLALKPVISGFEEGEPNDIQELLAALELEYSQENIDKLSCYRFKEPLSPNIAAEREGASIDFEKLRNFCQRPQDYDYLLIEGVGGAMVPLTNNHTVLDLIKALDIPSIVVTGTYLGSLSHTLSTLKVMEASGVRVSNLIVSESEDNNVGLQETISTLQEFTQIPIMALPRIDKEQPWRHAPDITQMLNND